MIINIKPEHEQLIKAQIASGRFTNVDEVIDTALRLLEKQQKSSALEAIQPDTVASDSKRPRLYRKHGILVIETGQCNGLDVNALVNEMREERIQEQIGKIGL